jgi:hypothetical protein
MWYYIKRFGKLLLIIIAAVALIFVGYFGFQDIVCQEPKKYVIEKYNIDSFKVFVYKHTSYAYSKEKDCSSAWFKECTDDEDLKSEIYLIRTNGDKIHVTEHKDGSFTDEYIEE